MVMQPYVRQCVGLCRSVPATTLHKNTTAWHPLEDGGETGAEFSETDTLDLVATSPS